jgi:hypothetical protein
MGEIRILLRDFAREWRGESPSKYPGLLHSIRYKPKNPTHYAGGRWHSLYVAVLTIPADLMVRVVGCIRWQFKRRAFQRLKPYRLTQF